MKKVLSMLLCLTMILGIFSAVTVSAATILTVFKLTIDAPKIGEPLSNKASLPSSASTYVTNVEWEGELD